MISNYNLLDNEFNQLNDQQSSWKKTVPLKPKHYFKKFMTLIHPTFPLQKTKKNLKFSMVILVD